MDDKIGFGFCCVLFHLLALTTAANVYDGVGEGGNRGNPGVKLRITQKGLDYLNSVLLYEMNEIIPRLHLDDVDHSSGNGHIRITNGRVTGYKAPTSQTLTLSPPDQIVWSSSGANIAMSGHVQVKNIFPVMFQDAATKDPIHTVQRLMPLPYGSRYDSASSLPTYAQNQSGSYGRFGDEGDADAYANNINFVISIQPTRQGNGQFAAKTRSCTASVGALDFNIYNTGMLGKMLQNNKGALIKRLQPRIADQMCRQATKLIDQAANEQLAHMPTKVPLNESASHMFSQDTGDNGNNGNSGNRGNRGNRNGGKSKGKHHDSDNFRDIPDGTDGRGKSGEARNELTKNVTKHLMFDYSNIKEPSVQSRFLETYNKGEISYHGQGGTPFAPPPMRETSVQTDRMVYALASDFVANSMLYNAYSHDLLKTRISAEETPDLKAYLKTNCDGDSLFDMCLGSIIPEMQETFPDSQAEILFEATKAPALFFRKEGTVNLLGQGLVKLLAVKNGQRKTMAVANVDMTATAKLFISDNKIKGNCTIDKYDVDIKENNLKGFNKDRQKEFTDSSKSMMTVVANAYLKNGFRLPAMKAVKMRNSKLNVFERTARIDTDLEADKPTLTRMAVKVIQKHGGRVDGY